MKDFYDISGCPPAYVPDDPTDVQAILQVLVEAEQCAVRGHTHICSLTAGVECMIFPAALSGETEDIGYGIRPGRI
jgi:ferritin-like protein